MEAMARAQIGRLPVVDDNNTLAGIVTLGSLALRSKKDKETLAAAKAVSSRSVKVTQHQASSSRPKRNEARTTKEPS
jgi:CBS-domain-containing membrane protein